MLKDFYHLKRDNNPHREDAFTLSCLGKLYPASAADLLRCKGYLSQLLDISLPDMSITEEGVKEMGVKEMGVKEKNINNEILIIGLTESGIIPAMLMYIETLRRNLNTRVIYSTRRSLSGISFKETHSHGPDHILPLMTLHHLNSTIKEIWIVEDEITSGNTVYNLMVQLCAYLKISRVRIFAFADFRDSDQKYKFSLKTAIKNIECTVHTVNNNIINNTTPHHNTTVNHNITPHHNKTINHNNTSHYNYIVNPQLLVSEKYLSKNWHLPEKRPALAMQCSNFLDPNFWQLPSEFNSGTLLTIGESVDLAACFVLANENILFQQISLSPWKVDNQSIFSRMNFAEKYYLYNYEKLKDSKLHPILILCDPIDNNIKKEVIITLSKHGIYAKPFEIKFEINRPILQISEQPSMESAFLSQS